MSNNTGAIGDLAGNSIGVIEALVDIVPGATGDRVGGSDTGSSVVRDARTPGGMVDITGGTIRE